jgi:uncharacterized GH25 family protein
MRGLNLIQAVGVAVMGVVSGFGAVASAHEFWVQPMNFRPGPSENVGIRLMVGDGFPGEARPRDPNKLERFVVAGTVGEMPIPGKDGAEPAGLHRFERDGVHVLGYRGKNSRIELDAGKFEAYLKEEGLGHISVKRAERGESAKPGRELFSRCAKSLVCVGTPVEGDEGYARSLNMEAEITPLENPYLKKPGETLRVRVTHAGSPAANVTIAALNSEKPGEHGEAKTDGDGIATVTLSGPGVWLLNTIHMTEAPAGSDADWQSVWGSLTFEVMDAEAAGV